jgi:hypothetical protein
MTNVPTHVAGQSGRGTNSGASISVTMTLRPKTGNMLVVGCGGVSNPVTSVSSISGAGAKWGSSADAFKLFASFRYSSIWHGVVGANPTTNITITLSGIPSSGYIADVYEYTIGSPATWSLDQIATNGGTSTTTSTGSTLITTQAKEVWVGCVAVAEAQSSGISTGSFNFYDGVVFNSDSVAFLDYVANANGVAVSGTSISSASNWSSCIATFFAVKIALNMYGDGLSSYTC